MDISNAGLVITHGLGDSLSPLITTYYGLANESFQSIGGSSRKKRKKKVIKYVNTTDLQSEKEIPYVEDFAPPLVIPGKQIPRYIPNLSGYRRIAVVTKEMQNLSYLKHLKAFQEEQELLELMIIGIL